MAHLEAYGTLSHLDHELVASLNDFHDPSQEWSRLFSELLGTFFLVLVAAGGGMMGQAFPGTISRAAAVVARRPGSQLRMVQPHPGRRNLRPAELRLLKRLGKQAQNEGGCRSLARLPIHRTIGTTGNPLGLMLDLTRDPAPSLGMGLRKRWSG